MPEELERKLAAILAADIAGYSALMGANEEATVRDLKAHQAVVPPMISEHGGWVMDTASDGILASRQCTSHVYVIDAGSIVFSRELGGVRC